jgi:hypothetical protein
VGRRALGYRAVRTQAALVRPLGGDAAAPPREVEVLKAHDRQAQWRFERCAGEWGAAAIRDAAFLTWRFLEHPEAPYTLYGVRDGEGVLRGLAVYRRGAAPFDGLGLVVDWLVPSAEDEVGALLLAALRDRARGDGLGALAAWIPEHSPWFGRFQQGGFLVHPTPWRLALTPFTRRVDEAWMREAWWYTLADSDLA